MTGFSRRNWKLALSMDTKSTTNGDTIAANEKEILQIESDLAQTSISEPLEGDPSLLGGDDVAELLQRLSSAETMAQGMESKIDSVLQDLDELLALLDAEETPTTEDASAPDTTKTSSGSIVN